MIVTSLSLGLLTSIALLVISVRRNFQLMDRLETVEDAVDDALEILDEQHQKIDMKTKIEVFSDEPVVRDLVTDIFVARKSVLEVARILNSSLVEDEEEPETKQENT